MNIKQILLGSRLGGIAITAREYAQLLRTALVRCEAIGGLENDILAGRLVASICRPGKTFVDVGAHIGSVIAAVQRYDSTVKLIAIEAVPEKAMRLRGRFPGVVIHECAVDECSGQATFYVDTHRTGYSSLMPPAGSNAHRREIQVPVRRLDDLLSRSTQIDVVKLDIEGAELGALRGATSLLSRCSPVVMFESGPAQAGSPYTKPDLFDFFHQRDYAIIIPNRLAHNDDGLGKDGFIEAHLYPRRTTNYFAVHRSRRTEIRDRARAFLNIREELAP